MGFASALCRGCAEEIMMHLMTVWCNIGIQSCLASWAKPSCSDQKSWSICVFCLPNLTHLGNFTWFTKRTQKHPFPIIYAQYLALIFFPSKQHRRRSMLLMEWSSTWPHWDGSLEQMRQSGVVVKLVSYGYACPESHESTPVRSGPSKASLRPCVSWCCRSYSWARFRWGWRRSNKA